MEKFTGAQAPKEKKDIRDVDPGGRSTKEAGITDEEAEQLVGKDRPALEKAAQAGERAAELQHKLHKAMPEIPEDMYVAVAAEYALQQRQKGVQENVNVAKAAQEAGQHVKEEFLEDTKRTHELTVEDRTNNPEVAKYVEKIVQGTSGRDLQAMAAEYDVLKRISGPNAVKEAYEEKYGSQ
jgi:hypothetical protein